MLWFPDPADCALRLSKTLLNGVSPVLTLFEYLILYYHHCHHHSAQNLAAHLATARITLCVAAHRLIIILE